MRTIIEALEINKDVDWNENNPTDEFNALVEFVENQKIYVIENHDRAIGIVMANNSASLIQNVERVILDHEACENVIVDGEMLKQIFDIEYDTKKHNMNAIIMHDGNESFSINYFIEKHGIYS